MKVISKQTTNLIPFDPEQHGPGVQLYEIVTKEDTDEIHTSEYVKSDESYEVAKHSPWNFAVPAQ